MDILYLTQRSSSLWTSLTIYCHDMEARKTLLGVGWRESLTVWPFELLHPPFNLKTFTKLTSHHGIHFTFGVNFPFFVLIKLDRACIKAPLMQSLAMWRRINGRRNQFFAEREMCRQKGIGVSKAKYLLKMKTTTLLMFFGRKISDAEVNNIDLLTVGTKATRESSVHATKRN